MSNIICCITFAQQTCNYIVGFIEGLIKAIESFKKKRNRKRNTINGRFHFMLMPLHIVGKVFAIVGSLIGFWGRNNSHGREFFIVLFTGKRKLTKGGRVLSALEALCCITYEM